MEFLDRRDAGLRLASQLVSLAIERPVVVALPRGGVPIGFEVARALHAPLEILAVRKLGAPGNPEFAIGAIAEGGSPIVNRAVARRVGVSERALAETIDRESAELARRIERYRGGRPPLDLHGRTVVVVDDGLATGLTTIAAVDALRARGAARVVVAVPVGAPESVALVREHADEVICPVTPDELIGVGRWYRDFAPVSDEEVSALLEAASQEHGQEADDPPRPCRGLTLDGGGVELPGELMLPVHAGGLVIFAHGSGSSRLSPRNRAVAAALADAGLGTLLFDLLTETESRDRGCVFDIPLLASRLERATQWAQSEPETRALPLGYFGASTGAAAALHAAADMGDAVHAVVSRGGRPDLAADRLADVRAATLLIVGGRDTDVLELNRRAAQMLRCEHRLVVVDGADHLFSQDGALEEVAGLASEWLREHLGAPAAGSLPRAADSPAAPSPGVRGGRIDGVAARS